MDENPACQQLRTSPDRDDLARRGCWTSDPRDSLEFWRHRFAALSAINSNLVLAFRRK